MSAQGDSESQEKAGSRRHLLRWLKYLLAAALLAFVSLSLPWHDKLIYQDPASDAELSYGGEIIGDWRDESIAFRIAPDTAPPYPPGAAGESFERALKSGEPLEIARRAPEEDGGEPGPGYEWRPSFTRVFIDMDPRGLIVAFLALIVGSCFGVVRWWRILLLAHCPSRFKDVFRLTYLGLFFNLVLPGLTGGDLVKAVLVVREHPERRANALITVILDRMLGLWSLIGLATGVIWVVGERLEPLRWPVTAIFAVATVGVFLVLHPGPRRKLGIDRLLARLPQGDRLQKLDEAAAVMHGHPLQITIAVLLSIGNHLCVVLAVFSIGRAFGDDLSFATYIAVTSVANTLSAIPITPGGWGWGEQAFGMLFALLGSEFALGVAISVTYRLCVLGLGLCGGTFLLIPGGERLRQMREASGALGD